MTLPASGEIKASQVNTELGRTASAAFSMNAQIERCLADIAPAPGEIKLSDFYGKSEIMQTDARSAAASHATVNYGLECSVRRIGFFIWHNDTNADPGAPTATISGVAATRIVEVSTGQDPDIAIYATGCALFTGNPSGASGTIDPTWGALDTSLVVFRTLAYNLSAAHNTEIDGGTSSDGRVGLNVPDGGLIVGAAGRGNSVAAFNWATLTERGDETSGNRRGWAWDDFQPLATGDSRIIDVTPWTTGPGETSMVTATFAKL